MPHLRSPTTIHLRFPTNLTPKLPNLRLQTFPNLRIPTVPNPQFPTCPHTCPVYPFPYLFLRLLHLQNRTCPDFQPHAIYYDTYVYYCRWPVTPKSARWTSVCVPYYVLYYYYIVLWRRWPPLFAPARLPTPSLAALCQSM